MYLQKKLQNILIDSDYNLKLADFGFSSNQATNSTYKGSGEYMAPEIVLGNSYFGPAVDLFAVGVLLFYLVLEKPPFLKATAQDDFYKTIAANRYDLFWKIHLKKFEGGDSISDSFKDLINFMLSYDVIERGSLSEIRQHEWTQGPVASYDEVKEEFTKRLELIEQEALNNIEK